MAADFDPTTLGFTPVSAAPSPSEPDFDPTTLGFKAVSPAPSPSEPDFDPTTLGFKAVSPAPAPEPAFDPRKAGFSIADPEVIKARAAQDPGFVPNNDELRSLYDAEQNQTPGQQAVSLAKGIGQGAASTLHGVFISPLKALGEVGSLITNPSLDKAGQIAAGAVEGPSGAASGLVRQVVGADQAPPVLSPGGAFQLFANPLGYLGRKALSLAHPQSEDDKFTNWKNTYLTNLALSRQSIAQSLQEAEGVPASQAFAPAPGTAEALGTLSNIAMFEGAGRAVGAAGELLPGAVEAESPVSQMLEGAAQNGGRIPGAGTASSMVSKGVAAAGNTASAAGKGMSWLGGLPEDLGEWVTEKLSGSPELAEKIGKYANIGEALSIPLALVGGAPLVKAIAAVKGLEIAGKITSGLGDFAARLAQADATQPLGRLYALAQDADAPTWMRQVASSPVVQLAAKSAGLATRAAQGSAAGAAFGGGMSVLSGDNPEEIGENLGSGAVLGAGFGALHANAMDLRDRQTGALANWLQAHLDANVSPETLKQIPSWVALQAATLEALGKGSKLRFATATDPGSPFAPGGAAEGQAGWDDSAHQTLWSDPTKRDPGETIYHEFFHPVWRSLVTSHPEVKQVFDKAITANGKTLDQAKQAYVSAELNYTTDPTAIANRVAERDAADPDWIYSELLSDSAGRNLYGLNPAEVARPSLGQKVFGFNQPEKGGTIFKGFEGVFDNPSVRRLSIKAFQDFAAHRVGIDGAKPQEAPLTAADMGSNKAPFYPAPDGRLINPYGSMVDNGKGGQKFVAFPPSELRRRAKAEQGALDKYFPKDSDIGTVPDAFWNDPDVSPWTKAQLRTLVEARDAGAAVEGHYHRLNGENSSTSDRSWAANVNRRTGNVEVSWQKGFVTRLRRTKVGNLVAEWPSLEAAQQKARAWGEKKGPASLEIWGGDPGKFMQDSKTYLDNHAAGQPGESNGIGQQKRDVLNAFWFGDNKEYQAKNPLRASLKKADRQGVFRSLRVDRIESMGPAETDFARPDWEKGKTNFTPSADPRAVKAAAVRDENGDIHEGPYHAAAAEKYWETKFPGDDTNALRAWNSHANLEEGFTTNTIDPTTGKPEFLTREQAFQRAQELGQYKAAPSDDGSLESTRFNRQQPAAAQFSPGAGARVQIEGPDGKKYDASHDGWQDFSVLGLGHMAQITPLEDLPGGPPAKSTAYAKSLQEKGYKLPEHLAWSAPDAAAQSIVNQAAQEHKLFSPPNVINNSTPDVKKNGVKDELPHAVGPGTLRLVHLSSEPGLTTVDPKFFGKGRANNNNQRGGPKSYYFVEGSPLGGDESIFGQGGYHAHTAEISGKKIYDLGADKDDALGYFNNPNRWEADTELKKAGYDGVMVETQDGRKVVMLYKSQKVKPAGAFAGSIARPPASRETSGLANKAFFSRVTKGKFGKSEVPYEPGQGSEASPKMPVSNPDSEQFSPSAEDEKGKGGFVSQLSKVVDEKFSGKAMPAAQLAAILRNPQNGVKADELKWTGLDDFLKGKQRVSKQEVQDYLRANQVQVKEVTLGAGTPKGWKVARNAEESDYAGREMMDVVGPEGNTRFTGTPSEAQNYLSEEQQMGRAGTPTKFENYQLPGGENYREVLFQLPDKDKARLQAQVNTLTASISRDVENDSELKALQGRLAEAMRHEELWEDHPDNTTPPGYDNEDKFFQWMEDQPFYRGRPARTEADLAKAKKLFNVWAWRDVTQALHTEWDAKLRDKFGDRYSEISELQGRAQNTGFKSSHWSEPNVLAHTRINDRADAAGKPGLFCEEIQSDWHQQGRREGYKQPVTDNPLKQKHWERLLQIAQEVNELQPEGHNFGTPKEQAAALARYEALKQQMATVKPGTPEWEPVTTQFVEAGKALKEIVPGWGRPPKPDYTAVQRMDLASVLERNIQMRLLPPEETRPLAEEARRLTTEIDFINKGEAKMRKGVPDAPFKTTWHEMVFRRLVQMAAEQGKDWLGWTTGEQQAERYDLSQHIDELQVSKAKSGNVDLGAYKDGEHIFQHHSIAPDKVADYVGKDLAEKIAAQAPGHAAYSGLDLKVGGKGMKGFYDGILVDYANKFGKKFGAKVESRRLVTDMREPEWQTGEHPALVSEVHSLPITPEMKASVKQGVPLFSPPAEEAEHVTRAVVRMPDGKMFYGRVGYSPTEPESARGHGEALTAAVRAGYGINEAREDGEYGFETNKQPFVSRQAAQRIAADAGQTFRARERNPQLMASQVQPKGAVKQGVPMFSPKAEEADLKPTAPSESALEDAAQRKAEEYFSLGHGDSNPDDRAWVMRSGALLTGPGTDTHGHHWGHEVADRGFKGRYDAGSGSVSVVFPKHELNKLDHPPTVDDIPTGVYDKLSRRFKTKDFKVFSPAATEQTASPAFKKWFGDSKVVDEQGKPLVVYHGTPRQKVNRIDPQHGLEVPGAAFFTDNNDMAWEYTLPREWGESVYEDEEGNELDPGVVVPAYLSLKNPLRIDFAGAVGDATRLSNLVTAAKKAGHDGLIVENVRDGMASSSNEGTSYAIFDAGQVKHATENQGSFDAANPNIRFSPAATPEGIKKAWAGMSDAIIHTTITNLKAQPGYQKAKAASLRDAVKAILPVLKPGKLAALHEEHPAATLLPIIAEERTGRNALPIAFAHALAKEYGWKVGTDVVQANRAYHTGAPDAERLARAAKFSGPVVRGQEYILVDDVATSGGTLAALRAYVLSQGGKVVGATVLGAGHRPGRGSGAWLAPRLNTLRKLKGVDFKSFSSKVRKQYGRELETLSNGETLIALREHERAGTGGK